MSSRTAGASGSKRPDAAMTGRCWPTSSRCRRRRRTAAGIRCAGNGSPTPRRARPGPSSRRRNTARCARPCRPAFATEIPFERVRGRGVREPVPRLPRRRAAPARGAAGADRGGARGLRGAGLHRRASGQAWPASTPTGARCWFGGQTATAPCWRAATWPSCCRSRTGARKSASPCTTRTARSTPSPDVPPVQAQAVAAFREGGGPVLARLVERMGGAYTVAEGETMVAFVPPFARFPYEVWIAPRRPVPGPWAFSDAETTEFGRLLGEVVARLRRPLRPGRSPTSCRCTPHRRARRRGSTSMPSSTRRCAPPDRLKIPGGGGAGGGVVPGRRALPEEKAAELRAVRLPEGFR